MILAAKTGAGFRMAEKWATISTAPIDHNRVTDAGITKKRMAVSMVRKEPLWNTYFKLPSYLGINGISYNPSKKKVYNLPGESACFSSRAHNRGLPLVHY